ncbi:MAG: Protein N-acetyltransferase, RimJ/RimL family [Acidobacteria bacterium]|nr:Protein N-acetyltransferase, RimJ/RimL family [Acidobacteriota bacterium]
MNVLETERLTLRKLSLDDAGFILELLNDSMFLRFIGDKNVRDIEAGRQYILKGPQESYERLGFGLYLVALKSNLIPIGICGLVKRDALADVDIGFAFLPEFRARGYAFESAAAVKDYGLNTIGLRRLLAITNPDNVASIRVLEKIGLKFEGMIRLTEDSPEIRLYSSE